MSSNIIMLFGQANSGKDTIADILAKNHNGVVVALADPLKRLGLLFGFNESQLWGPSAFREALDTRFANKTVFDYYDITMGKSAFDWLSDVLPTPPSEEDTYSLYRWLDELLPVAPQNTVGLTPRQFLQTLGTSWGRSIDPDLWIKYALRLSVKLLSGGWFYDRTKGLVAGPQGEGPDFVVISDGRFRNELTHAKLHGAKVFRIEAEGATGDVGIKGHQSEAEQKGIPDHWFDAVIENDKKRGVDQLKYLLADVIEWAYGSPQRFVMDPPE